MAFDPTTMVASPMATARMHSLLLPLFDRAFSFLPTTLDQPAVVQGPLNADEWVGTYRESLESHEHVAADESDYERQLLRSGQLVEELEVPLILAGHKSSWLEVAPIEAVKLWEKVQLEPYATKKNVTFYVVCPKSTYLDPFVQSFFKELTCIYEVRARSFARSLPTCAPLIRECADFESRRPRATSGGCLVS